MNLKEILRKTGEYQEPHCDSVPTPDWRDGRRPKKRWYTLSDLVKLIPLLGAAIQYCVAIGIWLAVLILLVQAVLMGGCQ